jgi:hypothetical protein
MFENKVFVDLPLDSQHYIILILMYCYLNDFNNVRLD